VGDSDGWASCPKKLAHAHQSIHQPSIHGNSSKQSELVGQTPELAITTVSLFLSIQTKPSDYHHAPPLLKHLEMPFNSSLKNCSIIVSELNTK
jgi:hypothetical protein